MELPDAYIDEKNIDESCFKPQLLFNVQCKAKVWQLAPCSVGFLKKLMKNTLTNGQIFVKFVNNFYRQNFMLYSIYTYYTMNYTIGYNTLNIKHHCTICFSPLLRIFATTFIGLKSRSIFSNAMVHKK